MVSDDRYPGLPLEQRIGSIRDGEVTNLGPAVGGSKPFAVQPRKKSDMTDNEITDVINDLRAADTHNPELLLRAADALDALGLFPKEANDE